MKLKIKQVILLAIGLLVAILADQWTKWLAVAQLKDRPAHVIWDGVFELWYSENRGAAFGMFQGRQGFFFIIAVVVLAAVIFAIWKMPTEKKFIPLSLCAMFVAAGAIGNMIDRVMQGYVVDFFYFKLIDFPIFNVADCYVTVSTFCMVLLLMFYYKEEDLDHFSIQKKGAAE